MDKQKAKHDHEDLKFSENFLWGAATSAHQVEGNNTSNDWWTAEQSGKLKTAEGKPTPSSGLAADQYNRFEEDFELAKSLEHNAHRLSLEWSRIEPDEGQFNIEAIEHYKKVLQSLREKNLKVMLTLHHFTNPLWLTKKGGWENGKAPYYFERFVKKVVPELKDYVDLWVTINEPGIYMIMSYIRGIWPPQKKSKWSSWKVFYNMARAHKKAYRTIHQLIPNSQVGIANNIASFQNFHHHSLIEGLMVWVLDFFGNHLFYKLSGIKTHDFLGLNYYFNEYISFNGDKRLPSVVDVTKTKKDISDLGWEINPEGMFDILMDFSDYHKPVYITENGVASTNDDRRVRFLLSYLKEVYHAIQAGVDVKGYFYWSLIDNFEWEKGFEPRFGLIDIDYKTQKRTPHQSAYVYADIINHNGIPHHLLKLLGHGIHVPDALEIIRDKNCKNCKIEIKEKI